MNESARKNSDQKNSDESSAPVDIQRRMAELGQRYLERTHGELEQFRNLVARIPAGDAETLKSLEMLSHRIRGSGAMFGFELVSDVAGEIELLAADAKVGLQLDRTALQVRFAALLRVLRFVVNAARQ